MAIHPARAVASVWGSAAGRLLRRRRRRSGRDGAARLLVDAGMPIQPWRPCHPLTTLSRSSRSSSPSPSPTWLPRPACSSVTPSRQWRLGRRHLGRGLVGRPSVSSCMIAGGHPFAMRPRRRVRTDRRRRASSAAFTRSYLVVLGLLVAVARQPIRRVLRGAPTGRPCCRADPLPRHAYRRGTRGFAAFVTGLGRVRRARRRRRRAATSHPGPAGAVVAHPVDRRLRDRPLRRGLRSRPPAAWGGQPDRLRCRGRVGVAAYGLIWSC